MLVMSCKIDLIENESNSNPTNWNLTQPYSLSFPVAADGICGIGISPLRLVGSLAIKLGIEGERGLLILIPREEERKHGFAMLSTFNSLQMKGLCYHLHQRLHEMCPYCRAGEER